MVQMHNALDESLVYNALDEKMQLYNRKVDKLHKKINEQDEKLDNIVLEMRKLSESLQFFMEAMMQVKPEKKEEEKKMDSSYIS